MLVAIHGNGFSSRHFAEHWTFAVEAGWLVFHPLAPHLVTPGACWWDAHEENRLVIAEQAGEALRPYAVDGERVLLGGFS